MEYSYLTFILIFKVLKHIIINVAHRDAQYFQIIFKKQLFYFAFACRLSSLSAVVCMRGETWQ